MIIGHFHWQRFALKIWGQLITQVSTLKKQPWEPVWLHSGARALHLSCRSSLSCKHSQASAPSVPPCRHQERWQQVGTGFTIDQSEGGGVLQVDLPAIPVAFFRRLSYCLPHHLHVIQWPCLSCLRIGLYTSCCLLLLTYHLQISDRSALAQRPRPIHPSCTQRMIALRLYFCFLLCRVAVTCLYCLSQASAVNVLRLLFSSRVLIDSR